MTSKSGEVVAFAKRDAALRVKQLISKMAPNAVPYLDTVSRNLRSELLYNVEGIFDRFNGWTYSVKYFQHLLNIAENVLSAQEIDEVVTMLSEQAYIPRYPKFKVGTAFYAIAFLLMVHNRLSFWMERKSEARSPTFIFPVSADTGASLKIIRSLAISGDQNVYLAEDQSSGQQWVIKWDSSNNVLKEIKTYERIKKMGGQTPRVLTVEEDRWFYHGWPILVIEKLLPLDDTDDELQIGIQLLTNQLPFLHEFAVHADLKPDNIMKRNVVNGGPPLYFVIDMDVDDQPTRFPGEYKRSHWTPLFHSDQFTPAAVCSFRADLLELLYTMSALYIKRYVAIKKQFPFSTIPFPENWDVVKDPLTWLTTMTDEQYKDRTLWDFMEKTIKNIEYNDVLQNFQKYIQTDVPLGGEATVKIYRELIEVLRNPKDKRFADGVHPSHVAPINACVRCGEKERQLSVEPGIHKRIFCNDKCQAVFYKHH